MPEYSADTFGKITKKLEKARQREKTSSRIAIGCYAVAAVGILSSNHVKAAFETASFAEPETLRQVYDIASDFVFAALYTFYASLPVTMYYNFRTESLKKTQDQLIADIFS